MGQREIINNRVMELRRGRGFTQEELALRVNVTRQTIISIEKGNYVPSVLLALKLSAQLERRLEEVFWYENR
jgi:putative transcriptional regulator